MATVFPQQIQEFPTMENITAADGALITQYQEAKEAGNTELANQILVQITNYDSKIITANKMNTIMDTCYALEKYYTDKYSPAYVVSSSQPANQQVSDFWFEVTG